jgi:glyceraldehyde 3-phosphate dehydrogenase
MTVKVAINGYGRIGRCVHRRMLELGDACGLELAAINDITSPETLAHLLKYDSVHGVLREEVRAEGDRLVVGGGSIPVLAERDPASLPWSKLGVGLVLECTGLFRTKDAASKHFEAGARKVLLSAPGKGVDLTVVYGVNHESYDPGVHSVLSNASCTTNCLAPVVKVVKEGFGIKTAQMTTIHSYTNGQRILDLPHKDLRRARAAALSMIPTTTGAARAVTLIFPELEGRIDGLAIRVPTPNVSIVELTAHVEKPATAESLNAALRSAAEGELKGVLGYSEEPLVSTDFMGNSLSSIVDAPLTMVIGDDNVKVFSWYDNEWGYSARMVDTAGHMASRGL